MGGYDGVKPLSSCERYDPRVGNWEGIADMKHPRRWLAAAVVNDDLYALGESVFFVLFFYSCGFINDFVGQSIIS